MDGTPAQRVCGSSFHVAFAAPGTAAGVQSSKSSATAQLGFVEPPPLGAVHPLEV
jgi:hypothetical protein